MTKEELFTYYRENKNILNEIILIRPAIGLKYKFRHYVTYFKNKDYWLNSVNGKLYDTCSLLSGYEIPKDFDILESLKVGDIIVTESIVGFKSYYKKIDTDVFIECDSTGHIDSCKYVGNSSHRIKFIYDSEEIIKLNPFISVLNEEAE